MADATTDDIIVVGRLRPQNPGVFINYGNGRYGFRSSEPNLSPTSRPADAQVGDIVVIAHANDPANKAAVNAAAENVAKTVAILTPLIEGLNDSTVYTLGNGSKMYGSEIKSLWSKFQFYVSDTSFGNNRSGNVTYVNGIIVDQLDYRSFQGPGSYADPNYQNNQGMNFIILHELMHMTNAATAFYDDVWDNFQNQVANPTLDKYYRNIGLYFQTNESYVNSAVKAFEQSVGLSPLPAPTLGYYTP